MKAVIINKFGDLGGSIIKTDLDIPRPCGHEVLIKVKSAGVNRPDIYCNDKDYIKFQMTQARSWDWKLQEK